jgi:hypothetical protein
MPEEIEGASAVADPSREIQQPDHSFLDKMIGDMETKELTRVEPGEKPTAPEVEETDTSETPEPEKKVEAKAPPAEEETDDLGIAKLIPKKKVPATPPPTAKTDATKAPVKTAAEEKLSWDKAPHRLREAFQTTKTKLEQTEAQLAERDAKIKALEARPASPELEAKWKADLENERKGREAAEENLRIVGYEKSPDFEREHIQPLIKAWNDTMEELVDQEVDVDGVPRKTTVDDVQTVVGIANTIQANKKARELFGPDAAPAVLEARSRLRGMEAKKQEALETWRNKGTEHQQAKARETEELQAVGQSVFDSRYKSYAEKYPEIWSPTDEKEKAGMDAVKVLTDVALFGKGVPKFNTNKEAFEFWGKSKADVAARAAATPVLLIRNAALQEKIAGLEEKLKGYEISDPEVGNKGDGEGRRAPRKESNGGGGFAAAMAAIENAPGVGG